MKNHIIHLLLFLVVLSQSTAQEINLLSLSTKDYPKVSATFVAIDANGNRATPNSSDIKIFENNIQIPISNYVCPQPPPTLKPASIVITLDNSGSMSSLYNGETNMEVAKKAALKLVDELPSSNIEVAITSFDGSSLLRQDFTNDKTLLAAAINSIQPNGSTNYDAGLITPPSGALEITKKARYSKNIIFLTDGNSDIITPQMIINEAQIQNCTINIVCLNIKASKELSSVATATNGFLFENVKGSNNLTTIFSTLSQIAQGFEPCTIEWTSTIECGNVPKNLLIQWNQTQLKETYLPPINKTPLLTITPKQISLAYLGIGVNTQTTFSVKNNYSVPLQVSNIQCTNPNYNISPTSFSLAVGESITLQVLTTPQDSFFSFTELIFTNDQCTQTATAILNRRQNSPTLPLTLVKPNGGEKFVAGIDTIIRWKNVAPTDTMSLYYSTDNGKKWNLITNKASGLEYIWKTPTVKSDSCLIKVEFFNKPKRNLDSNDVSIFHETNFLGGASWDYQSKFIYYTDNSNDKNFTIYQLDAESGLLVDSISTTELPFSVSDIDCNPVSNLIATGSNEVLIINPITKSIEERLQVPSSVSLFNPRIMDVEWSPNGNYLAIGFYAQSSNNTRKNLLLVYDYNSKNYIFAKEYLSTFADFIRGLTWHPDNKLLAISGFDYEISIFDIDSKTFVKDIPNYTTLVRNDLSWSPDGKFIMTASGIKNNTYTDSTFVLYNVSTSQAESKVRFYSWSDNVEHNPKNNTIAIDSNGKVLIYDDKLNLSLQSLTPPHYRIGNSIFAMDYKTLEFNKDGTRLMGASSGFLTSDNAIIVWEIDDTNSQVDVSDSVFRIVVPELKTQAIDIGKVIVGSAKDSVITPFIENTSEAPFAVNEIRIIGPDASAFSLVSGTPVYTISAFSSSFGEFQFVPNRVGIHNAFVEVITQADSVVIPIQGEGIQDAIAQASKIIDFGTIDVFTRKDSLNVTTISAVSATPIQVTNARIEGGSATSFSILSPFAGNTTITSTDTLKLDLQFFAQSVGRVQSELILDHTGVGSPARITLFGNGRDTAVGNLRIVAPELTARTNTFLKIPIYLENDDNVTFSSNAIVDFNLRFNSTILTPRTANTPSTIANGERSVPFSFPLQPDANGVIGTIDVRVGLGNATSTPLSIDSVRVRNSPERIGKRDGLVTIIDICEEGGTRLVNSSTKVGLALMSAIPVSQQIELKLTSAEIGITTIQLYDTEGKLVSELWNGSPIIGDTYLTVRASNFPNGTYFLLLKTPTVQETIPFIIQR